MDEKILEKVYKEVRKGYKVAFATITKTIGSTPGKQGATMAVFEDGSFDGTVGGGLIEHKVIEQCKECLKLGQDDNFEYTLNDNGNLSMQCGGTAMGYIKVFKPRPKLLIIGGGHIGLALHKIAKNLDFYTIVVDERKEFANNERFVDVDEVYNSDIIDCVNQMNINTDTYIVIATRGYEGDLSSLREVINKEANYIGMIGSKKKWLKVKEVLLNENIELEKLERVYAPIGLDIASNDVDEIAFGIMAEILLVKNKGELSHRKM